MCENSTIVTRGAFVPVPEVPAVIHYEITNTAAAYKFSRYTLSPANSYYRWLTSTSEVNLKLRKLKDPYETAAFLILRSLHALKVSFNYSFLQP